MKHFLTTMALMLTLPFLGMAQTQLITNGNFTNGNTGFNTDYEWDTGLGMDADAGHYWVGANSLTAANTWGSVGQVDHTTGTGKYMIINGATDASKRVWYQTVNVAANTTYDLSLWASNLTYSEIINVNPAKLKVTINGTAVVSSYQLQFNGTGNFLTGFSVDPVWENITAQWNSGSSTSATIAIYDLTTATNCNDFGLDDISFLKHIDGLSFHTNNDNMYTCEGTTLLWQKLATLNDSYTPSNFGDANTAIRIVEQPAHGTADWSAEYYSFYYTPNAGFTGTDMFRYRYGSLVYNVWDTAIIYVHVSAKPEKTFTVTSCEEYTWSANGTTYTQSGSYQYIKPAPQSTVNYNNSVCDSIFTLNLTIEQPTEITLPAVTQCDSYTFNGQTYTQSGFYTTQVDGTGACPTIYHLPLTINKSDTEYLNVSACDSYTWHGQLYTSGGQFQYTSTNASGCNHLEILNLSIENSFRSVETLTECDEYYWPRNGHTYTASALDSIVIPNPSGSCDSTFVLDLTINNSVTTSETETACESYLWNGMTLTQSDTYTYQTTTPQGCPKTETLYLTINNPVHTATTETACEEYTWTNGNGQTYTTSGNYTYSHSDINGCTQVDTLHLTINHSDNTGIVTEEYCDSFEWNGETYTASGTYPYHTQTVLGCDSTVTLHLTINNSTTSVDEHTVCEPFLWIDGNTYSTSNNTATYTTTNTAGCDSVITLNLTVNEPSYGIDVQSACNSYTWIDGNEYTASNNTATYTLTNAAGCDSIVTLNLTIKESTTGIDTQEACNTFTWIDGNEYTESNNTATYTLTNAAGCDSVVTLNLTIKESTTGIDTQEACNTFTWIDGNEYTASNNTATYTLTNAAGCDSVVTLNLTIKESTTGIDTQEACDTFTWIDGNEYTASNNTATHTLTNAAGCDSIVTLNLTINNSTTGIDTQAACDSYTWIDGITYTESNNTATYTLTNAAGCDSIVTLNLTIGSTINSTDTQVACDSYTWIDGITYTASNSTATYTLSTGSGCDSIVTLNLTINNTTTNELEASSCENYTWDGTSYNTSGDYVKTYENASGCDSVVTLHLTINESYNNEINTSSCGSYTWNGVEYTEDGTYTQQFTTIAGCDSTVTMHLNINAAPEIAIDGDHKPMGGSETQYSENSYALNLPEGTAIDSIIWTVDCENWQIQYHGDSTSIILYIYTHTADTSHLTATLYNECGVTTTTFWIRTTYYGIEEDNLANISITPNPNKGSMNITLDNMDGDADVSVFDLNGNIVDRFVIGNATRNYKYDMRTKAVGVYYFRINSNGKTTTKKVVVTH